MIAQAQVTFWTPKLGGYIHSKKSRYGVVRSEIESDKIVKAVGKSHCSVISIFNEHLGMRKLYTRWVPCLLTINHKRSRRFVWHCWTAIWTSFRTVSQLGTEHRSGRDWAGVKIVGFSRQIGAREDQGVSDSQQSHGGRFSGCTRNNLHRLPSEIKNNQGRKLWQFIGSVQR